METQLNGPHRNTYNAVFRHPVARNLEWRDVRSMLVAVADAVQEQNGVLKVTRHGRTLVLHRPFRKGMDDVHELMKVRRFLEQADAVLQQPIAEGVHLLVVIDHRVARIYRTELQGSVPQRITLYVPGGFDRHLHYVQDDSNGQRKPERSSFYKAIATALRDAEQILIFGSGTGASSAMEQLLVELQSHYSDLANRVIGAIVVNEQHLTENQLLAMARDFYAATASQEPVTTTRARSPWPRLGTPRERPREESPPC
jgi:hypothetical protein